MKKHTAIKSLLLGLFALVAVNSASAGTGHDHGAHAGHDHDAHTEVAHTDEVKMPNGGRLVTSVEPHLEFYVTPERFVQITFIGHDGKVVPVAEQKVSAIGGDRSSPTKVVFVKKGDVLISKAALPDVNNMPMVLQVKTAPDAKTVREKFNLNLSDCPTCSFKEYACACGH
ncbi:MULTISPECIES: hypothetical protein [unclassified Lentimonas]|uniref:hypothetical protein n=1 Tax=unclassified Lentimonas TaxID=2630993 RepID=UPI00132777DE|nr:MULTISPECIES: hypothetical protein [unclassified Lentimonas]CAA6676717.1 Unannotated [Lentimonas sp. CC4]CAA6684618.1 Unannotated [Lentimonas sp. CC6]CAA7075254.1 Unannotated [Lentimonas sp. CC4]CAA7170639.1 Unannotated [Lentimonas sp. CC21]CAA7182338.1 Unannotated [Lentimonas sp. CC8]